MDHWRRTRVGWELRCVSPSKATGALGAGSTESGTPSMTTPRPSKSWTSATGGMPTVDREAYGRFRQLSSGCRCPCVHSLCEATGAQREIRHHARSRLNPTGTSRATPITRCMFTAWSLKTVPGEVSWDRRCSTGPPGAPDGRADPGSGSMRGNRTPRYTGTISVGDSLSCGLTTIPLTRPGHASSGPWHRLVLPPDAAGWGESAPDREVDWSVRVGGERDHPQGSSGAERAGARAHR